MHCPLQVRLWALRPPKLFLCALTQPPTPWPHGPEGRTEAQQGLQVPRIPAGQHSLELKSLTSDLVPPGLPFTRHLCQSRLGSLLRSTSSSPPPTAAAQASSLLPSGAAPVPLGSCHRPPSTHRTPPGPQPSPRGHLRKRTEAQSLTSHQDGQSFSLPRDCLGASGEAETQRSGPSGGWFGKSEG